MKQLFIISIFITMTFTSAIAQDQNFCNDKKSWKEWNELVQKYPHHMDIQMLHAVRIGFCKKIEGGTVTFKVAKDAFNKLHETVIKKAKEKQNQQLKNKQL